MTRRGLIKKIRRRFRVSKDVRGSSRKWREIYSSQLSDILVNPRFSSIDKAYSLTFTEDNEDNYQEILNIIRDGNMYRLHSLIENLPDYQDDLGWYIGTNIIDVVLLIDKSKKYFLAIVYIQYIGEFDILLKSIHQVSPFSLKKFKSRRLIFSI